MSSSNVAALGSPDLLLPPNSPPSRHLRFPGHPPKPSESSRSPPGPPLQVRTPASPPQHPRLRPVSARHGAAGVCGASHPHAKLFGAAGSVAVGPRAKRQPGEHGRENRRRRDPQKPPARTASSASSPSGGGRRARRWVREGDRGGPRLSGAAGRRGRGTGEDRGAGLLLRERRERCPIPPQGTAEGFVEEGV